MDLAQLALREALAAAPGVQGVEGDAAPAVHSAVRVNLQYLERFAVCVDGAGPPLIALEYLAATPGPSSWHVTAVYELKSVGEGEGGFVSAALSRAQPQFPP